MRPSRIALATLSLTALAAGVVAAPAGAGAGFQCRLDGGRYKACTSPQGYRGLKPGHHSFAARAALAGVAAPAPAAATVTIPAPHRHRRGRGHGHGRVSAARASAAPNAGAEVTAAVQRFVNEKGDPVETRMAHFADYLRALPRADSACRQSPIARAALANTTHQQAQAQVNDVLFVERGELGLYKLAGRFPAGSNRHHYVLALDQVGAALDNQLSQAKSDRRLAAEIGQDCDALRYGAGAAGNWDQLSGNAKQALGKLTLAYGM